VIIPFSPGSTLDSLVRLVVPAVSENLKATVVVENIAGGGTVLATEHVLKAPADGQTLLVVANSFVINSSARPKLTYDPLKAFAPLVQMCSVPHVLVVRPGLANNVAEFVKAAKAAGKTGLSYGTPGAGTSNHLLAEEFRLMADFTAVHVPYRGTPAAMTDLMAGRVDFLFLNATDVTPHINSGKMNAIAIAASKRSTRLPNVPTMAEAGHKVSLTDVWYGVVVRKEVPAQTLAALSAAWTEALKRPKTAEQIQDSWGLDLVANKPEEFGASLSSYSDAYAKVVRAIGLVIE
jgi:tripartite-type tricarboxylate transporter receptor subunit TctC